MSKKEFLHVVAWSEEHCPVDIVTTESLPHISKETVNVEQEQENGQEATEPALFFVYVGQSIAVTAADCYCKDLGGLSSKLGHLLVALLATTLRALRACLLLVSLILISLALYI
jgi:hypothetical protein